jgi:hypothetical protein
MDIVNVSRIALTPEIDCNLTAMGLPPFIVSKLQAGEVV